MAVGTLPELDLKLRLLALRNMALFALELCMSAHQRILGRGVFLQGEGGRLPSIHGVAEGALSASGAFGELAAVGIWFVTVGAGGEFDGLLEVAPGMALGAIYTGMLAQQGIFCFRVIEFLTNNGE